MVFFDTTPVSYREIKGIIESWVRQVHRHDIIRNGHGPQWQHVATVKKRVANDRSAEAEKRSGRALPFGGSPAVSSNGTAQA
jgi:hypothetical protein